MELRVRKFTTKVPDYDLGGVLGLALVVVLDARPPLREGSRRTWGRCWHTSKTSRHCSASG